MNFLYIYLLFWTFSFLGWIMEVVVCSICDRKLVNRGFLIGPYCPIYGFGSVIMLLLTPYKDSVFVCFILALFLCSVLEYFTSYIMEKLFKVRWWDYSNDSFNINGRICLRNALAFGALGVLFTRYLNPLFMNLMDCLSESSIKIISIIVFVITMVDIIVSLKAMNSVKNIVNSDAKKYRTKDATADIKKLINVNYLEKRLMDTYHLLEKEGKGLKKKLNKINNSGYGILLMFSILGIIVGLILCFIFKLDSFKVIIPFTLSISILIAIIIVKVRKR